MLYICGMAKKKEIIEHKKWERVYEDDETITIWRYDSKKSMINPYEVEIKYKVERKGVKRSKA